jgi:hypothetical protein
MIDVTISTKSQLPTRRDLEEILLVPGLMIWNVNWGAGTHTHVGFLRSQLLATASGLQQGLSMDSPHEGTHQVSIPIVTCAL